MTQILHSAAAAAAAAATPTLLLHAGTMHPKDPLHVPCAMYRTCASASRGERRSARKIGHGSMELVATLFSYRRTETGRERNEKPWRPKNA